jgi:hypothetical protein
LAKQNKELQRLLEIASRKEECVVIFGTRCWGGKIQSTPHQYVSSPENERRRNSHSIRNVCFAGTGTAEDGLFGIANSNIMEKSVADN